MQTSQLFERIRMAVLMLVAVLLTLSVTSVSPGADQKDEKTSVILITDCRIKLINQAKLSSDRNGVLKHVELKEGDQVVNGQEVALIQNDLAVQELAVAKHKADNDVDVRYSIKAAELAKTEYDKANQANQQTNNAIPVIEIKRLKLAWEKSTLGQEQARHEQKSNELQKDLKEQELKTYSILAPFNGVVTKVYMHRGEVARQGDPILELTNTEFVKVEGYVDLEHTYKVQQGAHVTVKLDIPDIDLPEEEHDFHGKITFVDVTAEAVTRRTKVIAEVANDGNILRAGLTANMGIHISAIAERPTPKRNVTPELSAKSVTPILTPDAPVRFERVRKIPTDKPDE